MILCMIPTSVMATSDQSHRCLAREEVGEGIILLKNNNNVLPPDSNQKVVLFGSGQRYSGSTSNGYQIGGGGSGWVRISYSPDGTAAVLSELVDVYEPFKAAYDGNIDYIPDAMYSAAAEYADTAVMFITRYSEENVDIAPAQWYLSDAENTMLKKLSYSFENIVVVINAPSAMAID